MTVQTAKQDVITEWVHRFHEDLYRYAMHKMPDENLAEDMVQNAFMAAITSYDNFKNESTPKTWLMSILKNKIMDHYRKAYRLQEQSLDSDNGMHDEGGAWLVSEMPGFWETEHVLDDPDFKVVLSGCLSGLPAHWNQAIHIKYLN